MKDAMKKKSPSESQDKAVTDQKQAATTAFIEMKKAIYDALEKWRICVKHLLHRHYSNKELDTSFLALTVTIKHPSNLQRMMVRSRSSNNSL